jgi:hypothetical protein
MRSDPNAASQECHSVYFRNLEPACLLECRRQCAAFFSLRPRQTGEEVCDRKASLKLWELDMQAARQLIWAGVDEPLMGITDRNHPGRRNLYAQTGLRGPRFLSTRFPGSMQKSCYTIEYNL